MIDKFLLSKIKNNEKLTKQDLKDSYDRQVREEIIQEQINKLKIKQ